MPTYEMKKLSMEELHRLSVEDYKKSEKAPLVVVLDNVRSQNNVGSVFRTGDAFRIQKLCLCGITAVPPHRDIHKTALGSEDSVDWQHYDETTDCVKELKEQGYKVFAVEQVDDSIKLGDENWTVNDGAMGIVLVFGNEIEGVQQEVISLCDSSLEIPQFGTKHSLNISCAAAIVIWEATKRCNHC